VARGNGSSLDQTLERTIELSERLRLCFGRMRFQENLPEDFTLDPKSSSMVLGAVQAEGKIWYTMHTAGTTQPRSPKNILSVVFVLLAVLR